MEAALLCGGVSVQPGDIVHGDEDGVVVFAAQRLREVMSRALEVTRHEAEVERTPEAGVKNAPGHPVAAGSSITISATPGKAQRPSPGLRELTAAVPTDGLHVPANAAARLREEGVV